MSQTLSGDNVTDSIFTWTFTANSGDSWGGTLVDDSTRYVVNSILSTAFGRYTIVAAAPQDTDLSPFGLDEGRITVSWYRDSSGVFLVTRNGEGVTAGTAGLGSETDAAWNGVAWDSFGSGGADQANPVDLPDSFFTWTFTADTGDVIQGTLLDDASNWNAGDTLRTGFGTYRIDTETPYGRDLGNAGVEGTITILSYTDFHADIQFTLETGASGPAGYGGFGSEWDRAWTGSAWVPVGQGGALQADRQPDRVFNWRFTASNGDYYEGTFIGHSTAFAVGDTIDTANGRYLIQQESPYAGPISTQGLVWVFRYYDASVNEMLRTYQFNVAGTASGTRGLGSEYDYAWDGDEWDDFGVGGIHRASVERNNLFGWTFTANSGDRYSGWLIASDEAYAAGDTVPGAQGSYLINSEGAWGGSAGAGTIYTTSYVDAGSGRSFDTYWWSVAGGQPSGRGGFGSESDYIWNGSEWDDFGVGGIHQANYTINTLHAFSFTGTNGSRYTGWLVEDSTRYAVGNTIATSQGSYRITWEGDWGGTQGRGTIWTDSYFDASSGRSFGTYTWTVGGGRPSGLGGFGTEYDYIWNGSEWDDFGVGGVHQARYTINTLHAFTFTATSGDRYTGWLVEDSTRYAVGDTIATSQGSYRITYEGDWGGAAGRGSIWTDSYFDAGTGRTFATYSWGTLGAQPSGRGGFGTEYDYIWDGDEWDDFGVGGLHQANVTVNTLFGYTFTANSGDRYTGWLIQDDTRYAVGDTIATSQGSYRITYEGAWGGAAGKNSIWTTSYFDAASNRTFDTYWWSMAGGQPSGSGGFGSEYDYVWNNGAWDDFGVGGVHQVKVEMRVMIGWIFRAASGDAYTGLLLEDADTYAPGDTITRPNGTYTIQSETATTRTDHPLGTIWTAAYYDAGTTQWLNNTWYYGVYNGLPSGRGGVGSEYDFVWNGVRWDDFGMAGAHQVDVVRSPGGEVFG
ncbi:hypothetical protein G3576_30640 [Roseomonas stagni]|uniref:Uncharacterized protein n=1 Tax=Falsiroseomonas algicola TaxID=2716930 RepID=A0A6M1LWP1_9PROT|nr:hypothetical protein [Falsiroseomonas algicola]NGM24382.1 hypothetical protein [Falsiroseomonas algicola]